MSSLDPKADPEGPGASPREALAIGAAVLVAAAVLYWWSTVPTPSPTFRPASKASVDPDYARYVGEAGCAQCHAGEAAAHARSGHARTLRPASRPAVTRLVVGKSAEDPERPGSTWGFAYRDGRLVLDHAEPGRDQAEHLPVEWAFGSGHHAITFLSLVDPGSGPPAGLEHRMTYYTHSQAIGVTPGQSLAGHAAGNTPSGRTHPAADTRKCFDCHATAISDRGPDVLDPSTMIPNVSCERCHGPGRSHVEAARRGASAAELAMPLGPGRSSAREQMEACGACHRVPEMVTPGAIRVDNPALVRHQPVGLMQSACYLKARGELSCVTCHDPHARTSTDRAAYEAACLSCHQAPEHKPCTVSPRSGCIECHMPRREVARGMTMTDHWIRRRP